ncbi:hypothetical protein L1987_66342 [Smallanthus sonchifolius]|uniref:Uncharacterized protein n=1 Tax=Smallanthus sonchifolius TaxID=185202 RepID=A0ACB9BWV8_9ASTR|nr:hypothetical protein L1987_66342 [Smallanthus sonchifolius]
MLQSLVSSVMPIMGLCELGNCPQTTGCGILRGTARRVVGARINLGSFYFVGTPVAVGLAFFYKVGFSDWEGEALRAEKLTSSSGVLEMVTDAASDHENGFLI